MIFGGDDNSKAASWKKKYYDSLEQIERKEQDWSRLEKTLRNAMSRMGVAIEGMDSGLDEQLEMLRHAVRHGEQGSRLTGIIESVIKGIDRLERKRKAEEKKSTPAESLAYLLQTIHFPKGTARRIKTLKKQLGKVDGEADLKSCIHEFGELLHESLALAAVQTSHKKEKASPREGLLGRLFGPAEGEKHAVEPKPATSDDATVVAATGGSAPVQISKEILATLLEKLVVPERRRGKLEALKQEMDSVMVLEEMHHLTRRLAIQISEYEEGVDSSVPGLEARGGIVSINELLFQLLEKIDFPKDAHGEIEAIQSRLDVEVSSTEWPAILQDIAELIGRMRDKAQQEKKEVENFLSQLNSQLQEVDAFMQLVESDQHNSAQREQSLGVTFRDHVLTMETSMREASDLDQLKNMVQQQMNAINIHMEKFLETSKVHNESSEQRIQELNEKMQVMERESTALRTRIAEERKLAMVDALTGIHNRLAFSERMEQEYLRWRRYASPLSLIVLDIDFFKKINDGYGHMAGDKVLKTIATLLQDNIRDVDFLARFGGEEFVIILSETGTDEALAAAEKLRNAVEHCGFHYRSEEVKITVSCGVSEFAEGDDPDKVFDRTDAALYRAKESGRNRCELG